MNLEWLRGNVSSALADFKITENGQLGAMGEQAMLRTDRFNKNTAKYFVISNGKKVRAPQCVLNMKQTRPGGKSKPLIEESTYYYSGWRRAIGQLPDEQRSWVLYCYGDYKHHAEQLSVVPYVWDRFMELSKGKRISGKVKVRLQGLTFLAVQVAAGRIKGWSHVDYTDTELAGKLGVTKQSFYKDYKGYWDSLLSICNRLDADALRSSRPGRNS